MPSKMRYVDRSASGMEIFAWHTEDPCDPALVTKLMRHIDFAASGTPIFADSAECCHGSHDDRVLSETCWPAPGITERIRGRVTEIQNCYSALCNDFNLFWDAGESAWLGSFDLRTGTVDVRIECDPLLDPEDTGKFTVHFSGTCVEADHVGGLTVDATNGCVDPLIFNVGEVGDAVSFPTCCECAATGPQSIGSSIAIWFFANCRQVQAMRYLDRAASGMEIWGPAEFCPPFSDCTPSTCFNIRCDLVLEIDATGDCADYAGTYVLPWYDSPSEFWQVIVDPPGALRGALVLTLFCDDPEQNSLRLDAACEEQADDDIQTTDDYENLDVTFSITLGGEVVKCCTGTLSIRVSR